MVSTSGSASGAGPDRTRPSRDDQTAVGASCSEIAWACVGNAVTTQSDDSAIEVRLGLIMAFTSRANSGRRYRRRLHPIPRAHRPCGRTGLRAWSTEALAAQLPPPDGHGA